MSPDPTNPGQSISGNYNAVASGGSIAIVNVYQSAAPQPIDAATVIAARALLARIPLNGLPRVAEPPPGSRMLFASNQLFVGREDDLRRLARIVSTGSTAAIGQIAAATGLGGIGKTQLAAEFAHRYGQYFTGGVFWLSFAEAANIPAEVALCGGAHGLNLRPDYAVLKIDEQVALVSAAWQSPLPRLLIFDNCEEEELLQQWRPRTGGCRIIVTSRRDHWSLTLNVSALPLGVLARTESLTLLHKFRSDLSERDPDLNDIAAELGDLPLALHLAGSYLEHYRHSLIGQPAAYLAALRQPDLLKHPSLQGLKDSLSPTGHVHHVARTFAIGIDQLNVDDPVDVLARQLLQRAASFAPGELIPRDLLRRTLQRGGDTDDTPTEDALLRLGELGLLETNATGDIRLHRLLATFVTSSDLPVDVYDAVEKTVIDRAAFINGAGMPGPLLAWRSHIAFLAANAESRHSEHAGELWSEWGYHLWMSGEYSAARAAHERALHFDEIIFGPDHPNVAKDVINLSDVLHALGDYPAARAACERALRIDEATFGPNSSTVARDVNNLGRALHALGDYSAARDAYKRALRINKANFRSNSPMVARDVNNLGEVLLDLGNYLAARTAFEYAWRVDEAANGPNHPHVARDVNNLGRVLYALGDYSAARAACERALRIDEAAFNPKHPNVARDVTHLGLVLRALGDYLAARATFERALRIDEATYGPNHPNIAKDVNNLGTVLRALGDYAGARVAFKRALRIDEATYGPNHPEMVRAVTEMRLLVQDEELAKLFVPIYQTIAAKAELKPLDKQDLSADVEDIRTEIVKDERADKNFVARRLRSVRRTAPDVWDMIITALANLSPEWAKAIHEFS